MNTTQTLTQDHTNFFSMMFRAMTTMDLQDVAANAGLSAGVQAVADAELARR